MHPFPSRTKISLASRSHTAPRRKERVNDVPTPFVTIILGRLKSGELAPRPAQVQVQNESSLADRIFPCFLLCERHVSDKSCIVVGRNSRRARVLVSNLHYFYALSSGVNAAQKYTRRGQSIASLYGLASSEAKCFLLPLLARAFVDKFDKETALRKIFSFFFLNQTQRRYAHNDF